MLLSSGSDDCKCESARLRFCEDEPLKLVPPGSHRLLGRSFCRVAGSEWCAQSHHQRLGLSLNLADIKPVSAENFSQDKLKLYHQLPSHRLGDFIVYPPLRGGGASFFSNLRIFIGNWTLVFWPLSYLSIRVKQTSKFHKRAYGFFLKNPRKSSLVTFSPSFLSNAGVFTPWPVSLSVSTPKSEAALSSSTTTLSFSSRLKQARVEA